MELFLHKEGGEDPEIVEVEANAKVRTLATDADGEVWLEEIDEAIDLDLEP
jgi:hypothetical protein